MSRKQTRTHAGYPQADADFDLTLIFNARDRERAVPGDIHNCILAQCAKRMYGSPYVAFARETAYVVLPDPKNKGVMTAFRFLGKRGGDMRKIVVSLDSKRKRGAHITKAETLLVLQHVSKGRTLDEKQKQSQACRARRAAGIPPRKTKKYPRVKPTKVNGEIITRRAMMGRSRLNLLSPEHL